MDGFAFLILLFLVLFSQFFICCAIFMIVFYLFGFMTLKCEFDPSGLAIDIF